MVSPQTFWTYPFHHAKLQILIHVCTWWHWINVLKWNDRITFAGPGSPVRSAEVHSDIPNAVANITNGTPQAKPSSKSATGRRSHSKPHPAAAPKAQGETTENGWIANMSELSEDVRQRLSFNGDAESNSKQNGGACKWHHLTADLSFSISSILPALYISSWRCMFFDHVKMCCLCFTSSFYCDFDNFLFRKEKILWKWHFTQNSYLKLGLTIKKSVKINLWRDPSWIHFGIYSL